MSTEKYKTHSGKVVAIAENGDVTVMVHRQSACKSCSSSGHCGGGGHEEAGPITFPVGKLPGATLGEEVEVRIAQKTFIRGVAMVYIIPMILMVLAAVIIDSFAGEKQMITALSTLGIAALWFVVLKILDKKGIGGKPVQAYRKSI